MEGQRWASPEGTELAEEAGLAARREATEELYGPESVAELVRWSDRPTKVAMLLVMVVGVASLALAAIATFRGRPAAMLPGAVLFGGAPVVCMALSVLSWARGRQSALRHVAAGVAAGTPVFTAAQAAFLAGTSGHERRAAMVLVQALWEGKTLAEAVALLGAAKEERERLAQASNREQVAHVLCEISGVAPRPYEPRALAPAPRLVTGLVSQGRQLGAQRVTLRPMAGPVSAADAELPDDLREELGDRDEEWLYQLGEKVREMLAEPGVEVWAEVEGQAQLLTCLAGFMMAPLLRHLKLLAGHDVLDEPPLIGPATVELPEGPVEVTVQLAAAEGGETVAIELP
jgi:hypothetical protein